MVEVKLEGEDFVLRFPKNIVSGEYLKKLIERLEIEEVACNNLMSDREAQEISEDIKQAWWDDNRRNILSRINKR